MGKISFLLALSVLTSESKVINNQEVALKRLVRSPCEDCDDSPRSSLERLRPRYLHPYPRHFDYPPLPLYYQVPPPPHRTPQTFGPPLPPGQSLPLAPSRYYGHHWHKVTNDNDEQDDNDSDYTDSAEAYSGIISQNSGRAFSSATVGIGESGNGRFGSNFSSENQSLNNQGGQYSGSSRVNAQLHHQSGQRYGEESSVNSGVKSPDDNGSPVYFSSTSSSTRPQSNDSSNRQIIEESSQSSPGVKSQSYINNDSQVSTDSHSQINELSSQSILSGISEDQNIGAQSIHTNKQLASSDIQSSISSNHSHSKINTQNASELGTFSNATNIQPSSKDRSTTLFQIKLSQLKTGVGSLRRSELNSQSNSDQRNSFTSTYNAQSHSLNSQTSLPLNVHSTKNVVGSPYQSAKYSLSEYSKSFSNKIKSSDDFSNLGLSYDDQLEQSNNNLKALTQGIQSTTNFNGVSSAQLEAKPSNTGAPRIQSLDYIGPYIDREPIDSNANSNFGDKPSNSATISTPFFVQSSNTDTQSSHTFGSEHSKNSNIHSFTMDDQICVCGPRSSTLLRTLSKAGPIHDFNDPGETNVDKSSIDN